MSGPRIVKKSDSRVASETKFLVAQWEENKRPAISRKIFTEYDANLYKRNHPNPHFAFLSRMRDATRDDNLELAQAIDAVLEAGASLGLDAPGWDKRLIAIEAEKVPNRWLPMLADVDKMISNDNHSQQRACRKAAAKWGFPANSFDASWREVRRLHNMVKEIPDWAYRIQPLTGRN